MTMIYTADHVNTLVGEIRHWDPKDKDLRRIADVLPLEVLEATYLKKLDAEANSPPVTVARAETPRTKIAVMRKICAAWLRCPTLRLGQLIMNAMDPAPWDGFDHIFFNIEDGVLAQAAEEYTRQK